MEVNVNLEFGELHNEAERFVDYHVKNGRGDNIAIITDAKNYTYKEVMENCNRTGNALRSLGLGMEDRVMLVALDCPEFVYTFWGAMKIGAVPIPTNTMWVPADYLYALNDSKAKVLVVSKELLPGIIVNKDKFIYLKKIFVIGGPAEGEEDFGAFISGFPTECETAPTTKDDMAFWLYSSGSTGAPKGTVHLHHNCSYVGELYGRGVLEFTEKDRVYSVARLFFAYGLGNALLFPFWVGAAAILDPGRPLPDHLYSVIAKHKPTVFSGVPTAFNNMLQVKGAKEKYDMSSVRISNSAGEPLPGAIYQQWKDMWGVEILDGIGSTEILHIYISNRIGQSKPDSSGIPVAGYEAKIVDNDGNVLPDGESGLLLMKGESTAAYYYNKHEKTKSAFQGYWFNTGDQYVKNADGTYTYAGRGDDMIKAGGIWVSPIEVENALMMHPDVLEAGVVGQEDEDALVKPKAFVVFKEGVEVTDALLDDVKMFVKKSIAPYKFPRWIVAAKELPKTATGKIQRFKLRETK